MQLYILPEVVERASCHRKLAKLTAIYMIYGPEYVMANKHGVFGLRVYGVMAVTVSTATGSRSFPFVKP